MFHQTGTKRWRSKNRHLVSVCTFYRNITLTNIAHFQNICYCTSFQNYKARGARGTRGALVRQFPVSAVMFLLTAKN